MKKSWRKDIFRGLCLTSVAFVFQACYGSTGADFGYDFLVEGKVVSKNTSLPIQGIRVSTIKDNIQYDLTDEDGFFSFYTYKRHQLRLNFEDIDSIQNNVYLSKDTLFTVADKNKIYLTIELEEKTDEEI